IDTPKASQAADRKSCPDEQYNCQAHFCHDENVLCAIAASNCSASALFKCVLQITAAILKCWNQAEKNSREQCDARSECQNLPVDSDLFHARQSSGQYVERGAGSPGRKEQSCASACNCQQDTFCQQLADNSSLACSQCSADRKLLCSCSRAGKQ